MPTRWRPCAALRSKSELRRNLPDARRIKILMYPRAALLILLLMGLLPAATVRLYLKDGTFHTVREYQKQGDRVKYYSTERGDWEEIPAGLVDFKRTESEIREQAAFLKKDAASQDEEEQAERAQRREVERIPYQTGVYVVEGETARPLKQAEPKAVTNKRRAVLKAMSPIPIVSGKANIEIDGVTSEFVVTNPEQEFYIRLAEDERFGIIKLTPGKTARLVEKWDIMPVTKEIAQQMTPVEIYRKQLGEGFYKIWPAKPLEPGEYAVIEYTEGKGNTQVWDFAVRRK